MPWSETSPAVVSLPFGLLDARAYRENGKANFALNVMHQDGALVARPGWRVRLTSSTLGPVMGLYGTTPWTGRENRLIIVHGKSSVMRATVCRARPFDGAGAPMTLFTRPLATGAAHDLSDAQTPYNDRLLWTFAEVYGQVYFSSEESGVFTWEPKQGQVEDAIFQHSPIPDNPIAPQSHGYYLTLPPCSILKEHLTIMYYAGIRRNGFTMVMDQELPSGANYLKSQRSVVDTLTMAVDHRHLLYSEPEYPWNIPDVAIEAFSAKDGITGLAALGDALIVMTHNNLFQFDVSGWQGGAPQAQVKTISIGAGCIGAWGVQETEIGVIYPGANGVYLLDGNGPPRIISEEIGPLWRPEGMGGDCLPTVVQQTLHDTYGISLPLRLATHRRDEWVSAYMKGRGLYILAVRLAGETGKTLLLVYDIRSREWYLWHSATAPGVPFIDFNCLCVTSEVETGIETLWAAGKDGTLYSMEMDRGKVPYDALDGNDRDFPCIWQTEFLLGTDLQKDSDLVRVRLKHATRADTPSGGYVYVETEEGSWTGTGPVSLTDDTTWPGHAKFATLQAAPDRTQDPEFTYYHGVGLHDSAVHVRRDIVTVKHGAISPQSDWFRLGLIWASSNPVTEFHSMSMDVRVLQKA